MQTGEVKSQWVFECGVLLEEFISVEQSQVLSGEFLNAMIVSSSRWLNSLSNDQVQSSHLELTSISLDFVSSDGLVQGSDVASRL
jgi:hypothetical protein